MATLETVREIEREYKTDPIEEIYISTWEDRNEYIKYLHAENTEPEALYPCWALEIMDQLNYLIGLKEFITCQTDRHPEVN